jgi:hypothetical protein
LACQLIHKKKNNLASNEIRITKAGVQDKEAAEKKKGVSISAPRRVPSGRGGMRGGMRGGRGRGGRGGPREERAPQSWQ